MVYLRVSTDKQGASGLGLEAQRETVQRFVQTKGTIAAEYVEVESGKKSERPELMKALAQAKKRNAVLLIAKLDRLARNVAFIANLLESGVSVTAADMPEANRFMFHVMAAVAEQEGKAISERTKAALAVAKSKGTKLGWGHPDRVYNQLEASHKGAVTNFRNADKFAQSLYPIIQDIQKHGAKTLAQIANILNERGIRTARNAQWHPSTVRGLINRQTHLFGHNQ